MQIIDDIQASHAEYTAPRRDIHTHPELGFEENRTSALVAAKLREWGYEVTTGLGKTGVIGTLHRGSSPRSIGIRADMDALPMRARQRAKRVLCLIDGLLGLGTQAAAILSGLGGGRSTVAACRSRSAVRCPCRSSISALPVGTGRHGAGRRHVLSALHRRTAQLQLSQQPALLAAIALGSAGLGQVHLDRFIDGHGTSRHRHHRLALQGNPQVLFLDEPTTGLDPRAIHFFWDTLAELRDRGLIQTQGLLVLLGSHRVVEAQALDEAAITTGALDRRPFL